MAKIFKILLPLALFVLLPYSADAAALSFSQSANSYAVGSTFSVHVFVTSTEQAMNAVSGTVSFPWDKLEVVSLSKTGSVISLWAEEPSFSNASGTVNFEGIVLNPGYTGSNGKVLTITFRAKAAGQANLSFSSGSILANDGSGTSILKDLRVSAITISDEASSPSPATILPQENTVFSGVNTTITSPTHPDPQKWYPKKDPVFSWKLPAGALEVRTPIGTSPVSEPTVSYIPPIPEKKVEDLSDGTYYFHLQIRTDSGWGPVSHYRVNIDTTPPKPFEITFPHGATSLEPQPVILFNTTDDGSGISHYDIRIEDDPNAPQKVAPLAFSNPYPLPPQDPGEHIVEVTAVDRAGNMTTTETEFTIEGIDAPVITYYTEALESGDIAKVRGHSYPNSEIRIFIRQGNDLIHEDISSSGANGIFSLIVSKRLQPGTYTFTVQVTDARGAKSPETAPLTIEVTSRFLAELTAHILDYVSVLFVLVLAIGSVIGSAFALWYYFGGFVRRIRNKRTKAEEVLAKAFGLLRKDIEVHIERLEKAKLKRKLSVEEVKFLKEFKRTLTEAQEAIADKIDDI